MTRTPDARTAGRERTDIRNGRLHHAPETPQLGVEICVNWRNFSLARSKRGCMSPPSHAASIAPTWKNDENRSARAQRVPPIVHLVQRAPHQEIADVLPARDIRPLDSSRPPPARSTRRCDHPSWLG